MHCDEGQGEDSFNCPEDCLDTDCGNGFCEGADGENAENCPRTVKMTLFVATAPVTCRMRTAARVRLIADFVVMISAHRLTRMPRNAHRTVTLTSRECSGQLVAKLLPTGPL